MFHHFLTETTWLLICLQTSRKSRGRGSWCTIFLDGLITPLEWTISFDIKLHLFLDNLSWHLNCSISWRRWWVSVEPWTEASSWWWPPPGTPSWHFSSPSPFPSGPTSPEAKSNNRLNFYAAAISCLESLFGTLAFLFFSNNHNEITYFCSQEKIPKTVYGSFFMLLFLGSEFS